MRILMTADTIGGVWTYAIELASALAAHDVHITLATMGAPLSASQREQAGELSNLDICPSAYKLEWMESPWDDVRRAGDWLLDLESQVQPDVIHLNNYAHGSLPWRAPALIVAHSCVRSWWRAVKREALPASWGRYCDEVSAGLRAVDRIVAPTRAMLDGLGAYEGPLPPAAIIHNARDVLLFQPGFKEPFILSAGRLWDEAKNLAALDGAGGHISWPIYAAGDDRCPDGRTVRSRSTHPLGRLTAGEMGRWLGRAAIYAHPAWYEPFGLSILEAGLSRCALVLGDIPSLRELWDGAALFVPPDDADALVSALELLIDSPGRRDRLAQAALDRARRFSPQRMAQGYLNLYSEIILLARRSIACA